jgi:hypothetical protein
MPVPKPKSKILKGGDHEDEANWLPCIPWIDYGRRFPVGVILPPGIRDVTSLIKSVMVLDAEVDEGFKVLKKSEVTKDMEILNVQLNENSIALIVGPAGLDSEAIVIIDPDGGAQYTRLGWWETHDHTDGLGMIAGNRFRTRIQGLGVQIGGR